MKNTQINFKPILFDENRMVLRQSRAIKINAPDADFLAQRVSADFSHRLNATNRHFDSVGDFFSFSNRMSAMLGSLSNASSTIRYEMPEIAKLLNPNSDIPVFPLPLAHPDEALISDQYHNNQPEHFDLIVSMMGLHNSNNLLKTMTYLFHRLKSDGLLLIALPINGTLNELRDCLTRAELELSGGATIRVDSFISIQQAGSLLQAAGFKLPVVDREELIVRYDDIYALVDDLRAMAMTSVLKLDKFQQPHRELFKRADELYRELYSDEDGRIRASFNYANLTAWAPHESQQSPLKPGSAKTSLASHLKSN